MKLTTLQLNEMLWTHKETWRLQWARSHQP